VLSSTDGGSNVALPFQPTVINFGTRQSRSAISSTIGIKLATGNVTVFLKTGILSPSATVCLPLLLTALMLQPIQPMGIRWKPATLPSSQNWTSVALGNGKFVAITDGSK